MRKGDIIIIGGRGHAKGVIDIIRSRGMYNVAGILDPKIDPGQKVLNIPVLGGDETLGRYVSSKGKVFLALGIGAIRASSARKAIFGKFSAMGFSFPVLEHISAVISPDAAVMPGTQIMAGAVICADARIGENVVIYSGCVIEHECRIASHVYMAPGVVMGGNVEIGEGSFIGIGARIAQDVRIGRGVTVGAGSVVIKDIEDEKIVCGIPAKEIAR